MSENNEQLPQEEIPQPVEGPGRHLREAREEAGLSLQQVAAELRIQPRIVEALENDDYAALPGNTFVQGYLRSYARLLGIPEKEAVALAKPWVNEESRLVGSISESVDEMSSGDLPIRMVSYLVVLAAIVGLVWWLAQKLPTNYPSISSGFSQESVRRDVSQLPVAGEGPPSHEMTEGSSIPVPVDGVTLTDDNSEPTSAEANATVPDSGVTTDGQGDQQGNSTLVDSADATAPEQKEDDVQFGTPPAQLQKESLVMVVAEEDGVPPPPPLSAEMPQTSIELRFEEDSWSEISDAAGRRLVYRLIPAGNRLVLNGEAPFKVFLGYAPGVSVYYNGDLYDHTPYQRGDVARFRIGRPEHNRPLAGN